MTKNCINCGSVFAKPSSRRGASWAAAKYCSQLCYQKTPKSESTREKTRLKMLGNKHSLGRRLKPEQIEFLRKLHTGNTYTKGMKHTEEAKRKISLSCRGEKSPCWISDRSLLKTARKQAYDYRYKDWMRQVKNRDYWKCQISNDDCSGRVEAHHILSWREHPELRYEVKNGITLCHFHHPRKLVDEKRLEAEFQRIVSASSETL